MKRRSTYQSRPMRSPYIHPAYLAWCGAIVAVIVAVVVAL